MPRLSDTSTDALFAQRWAEGVPLAEIAAELGVKIGQCVRKRKRLALPTRTQRVWTAEQDEIVRQGWAAGDRMSVIASRLPDGTPSAVKSRAASLKLGPYAPTPKMVKARPKAERSSFVVSTNPEEAEGRRREFAASGAKIVARFEAPAPDDAILLLKRRAFQCAWPVGMPDRPAEQLCCGRAVAQTGVRTLQSYCTEHGGRAASPIPSVRMVTEPLRRPMLPRPSAVMSDAWGGR